MAVEEASSRSGGGGGEEGSGGGGGGGGWTREQEKAFENALATMGEDEEEGDGMWEKIGEAVEGKTPDEVRRHYELLVEDVDGIEAGRVPLLVYAGDGGVEEGSAGAGKKGGGGGGVHGEKWSAKSAEQERRKGIAWTEDEHSLFTIFGN